MMLTKTTKRSNKLSNYIDLVVQTSKISVGLYSLLQEDEEGDNMLQISSVAISFGGSDFPQM